MRHYFVAERERDYETHADEIVRHAGGEVEAVAREVNHLADVFDVPEAGIEGAEVNGEGYPHSFPAARVTLGLYR